MPDESTPKDRDFGDMERDVVYLLTDPGSQPSVWSVPDIGREIDYFDPESVVYQLCRVGLAHKTSDGFVLATPAAFHLVALVGHVI